jgi:hypothetical protein
MGGNKNRELISVSSIVFSWPPNNFQENAVYSALKTLG